jgi:hypothetical protein
VANLHESLRTVPQEEGTDAAMTRLVDVVQEMGLEAEGSPFGRWVRFRGEQGLVYVAQAAFGQGYYTWCDTPHGRAVEPYLDPAEAIQAGLQRAADEEANGLIHPLIAAEAHSAGRLTELRFGHHRAVRPLRSGARTA